MPREPVYDILNCGPRHRFVANGKVVHNSNFQNFSNRDPDAPGNLVINDAICAPEGFLIAAPDASQIECRLLNFVAGQHDKVEEFRSGADPYIAVASEFYKKPINKKDHPMERQLGKIVELQAGYQSGGNKIRATIRVKSKRKILLSPAEGVAARDAYRATHPAVVALWAEGERWLRRMAQFESGEWMGCVRIACDREKGTRRVILPNGIALIYDTLEWFTDKETGDSYWRLKSRKGWTSIYGGKFVQNLIQALARVVVSQAMLRLKHRGYRTVSMKHDELWILVPIDGHEKEHERVLIEELSRTPAWLPGIPLGAESVMGPRYMK